jgi:hypothetical protein
MSQDFRVTNMNNLKDILNYEKTVKQFEKDERERQILANAGIATHEVPTFRFSRADWERGGGKRSRRRTRGKRRKTNKKRRSTKRRR